ncbi:MAG: peroxiredoxin [Phycisphaerae bacterium]|jgi:peroxiredoxin Q/BCP
MPTLEIGRSIPDITLQDSKGAPRRLKDLVRSWLVVYFYPKDMTPGCTTEACDFTDRAAKFDALDVAVVGVSPDSVKSHAAFIAKEKLGVELLADPPASGGTPPGAAAFGVWGTKSMYGRTYQGVIRSTFLIGRDGKVAKVWENVKVPGHAADVLAAVEELSGGADRAKPAPSKPKPEAKSKSKAKAKSKAKPARSTRAAVVASAKGPRAMKKVTKATKTASTPAKKVRARG